MLDSDCQYVHSGTLKMKTNYWITVIITSTFACLHSQSSSLCFSCIPHVFASPWAWIKFSAPRRLVARCIWMISYAAAALYPRSSGLISLMDYELGNKNTGWRRESDWTPLRNGHGNSPRLDKCGDGVKYSKTYTWLGDLLLLLEARAVEIAWRH